MKTFFRDLKIEREIDREREQKENKRELEEYVAIDLIDLRKWSPNPVWEKVKK
jgi:hypothetical protein